VPRALLGLLAGLVGYAELFSWIQPVFRASGEHPVFALAAIFILALYLALYLAVFVVLVPAHWDVAAVAGCAAAWVLLELLRSWAMTGFPWALLGHTQYQVLPLIQVAEIGGVYLVGFSVVWCNLAIAALVTAWMRRESSAASIRPIVLFVCIIAVQACYGFVRLHAVESVGRSAGSEGTSATRVVLLQPNIDQYQKWDDRYVAQIRDTFRAMVREAAASRNPVGARGGAVLFVWPESAVPGYLFEDPELMGWLRGLISESVALAEGPVHHLIGAVGAAGSGKSWNMAVLFDGSGNARGLYRKIRLVPFGEFVPMKNLIGSLVGVVNQLGEFEAGTEKVVFRTNGSMPPFCALICYESLFPCLTADFVRSGADVLINITNDGWYLETDCPYQHYSFNVFRAIETRRYLLRAANTGISAVVAPSGRSRTTTLMTRSVLETILVPRANAADTVYVHTAQWHWVLYACGAGAAMWIRRKQNRAQPPDTRREEYAAYNSRHV